MSSLKDGLPRYITSERLTLELFDNSPAHYDCLLSAMNSSPDLAKLGIVTPEGLDNLNRSCRVSPDVFGGHFQVDLDLYYLIRIGGPDGKLVGGVSLCQRAQTLPPDAGWGIEKPFWGHGYAAEGARAVLDMLKTRFNITQVMAWPLEENHQSIRVAEKAGFVRGGILKDDKGQSTVVYILPGTTVDYNMTLSIYGSTGA